MFPTLYLLLFSYRDFIFHCFVFFRVDKAAYHSADGAQTEQEYELEIIAIHKIKNVS